MKPLMLKRPAIGSKLTLAFDYWSHGAIRGVKVKVLKCRKDRKCSSGLRVFVEIPNRTNPAPLCAFWFQEYEKQRLKAFLIKCF